MARSAKKAERITQLKEHRVVLVAYLQKKVDEEDWHGVCDAGMDLRDIDNELWGLENY